MLINHRSEYNKQISVHNFAGFIHFHSQKFNLIQRLFLGCQNSADAYELKLLLRLRSVNNHQENAWYRFGTKPILKQWWRVSAPIIIPFSIFTATVSRDFFWSPMPIASPFMTIPNAPSPRSFPNVILEMRKILFNSLRLIKKYAEKTDDLFNYFQ